MCSAFGTKQAEINMAEKNDPMFTEPSTFTLSPISRLVITYL